MIMRTRIVATGIVALSGCRTTADVTGDSFGSAGPTADSDGAESSSADESTTHATSVGETSSADDDPGTPKLDVDPSAGETGPEPPASCDVPDGELDGIQPCDEKAPPDSFDAEVEWAWPDGGGPELQVVATPLVANLTDDNADDAIDLCDTPDVIVIAYESASYAAQFGRIHVIDGGSGEEHFEIPIDVLAQETPAVGDIDGD